MSAMHSAPSIFRLCPSIFPFPSVARRPFEAGTFGRYSHIGSAPPSQPGVPSHSENPYHRAVLERMGHDPVTRTITAVAAVASVLASPAASAQSVEEFYKSRSVTIMVGFNVGNIYDTVMRAVARHI